MADIKLTQPITLRDFSRGLYSDIENPLRPLNAVSGSLNCHFDKLPLVTQRKGYTILATQISGSSGDQTFDPTTGVDGYVGRDSGGSGTVEILVVAGGGAGGGSNNQSDKAGGGGGAGGYRVDGAFSVEEQAYAVTVGSGGSGVSAASGGNGNASSFDSSINTVGGGGGGYSGASGKNGGSGGGGAELGDASGGAGTSGEGNNGGSGDETLGKGGGGGGASGAGAVETGGAGTANSISGSSVTYSTGANGGGSGSGTGTDSATPGSGGGGKDRDDGAGAGDGGQAGIVIVSFATDGSDGPTTDSTGGTITTSGSQTIHTFTSNGTFTPVFALSESFSAIRTSAGTVSSDSDTSEKVVMIKSTSTTDEFDELRRGDLVFDSSAILDPAVLNTGKVRIYVNSKTVTLGSQSLSLVSTTTASNTSLADSDYGSFGTTKLSADVTLADLTTGAYNELTLNTAGLAAVNKTGFTKMGLRLTSDVAGSVTWASEKEASVNIDFFEGTNTPQLVVNSTVGTDILGLHQFLDADGSDNQVMVQAGGIMYYLDGSSWTQIDDTRSSSDKERFVNALDLVFYTSKTSGMKTWDGSGTPGTTNAVGASSAAYLEFFKNKVYAFSTSASPDRLFLSSPANNALAITWDTTNNFIDINPSDGQNGAGLKRVGSELLIFKRDYVYRFFGLAGLDPDPLINVGTYSHESIVTNKAGAFWHHPTGLYLYAGGQPSEISRPIDDFVRNISRSEYDDIAAWGDGDDGDHVYWSVGDITIGSVTFTNIVLRYTISSQVWAVYSYASRFKRGIIRDTGTNLDTLVGDTNSTIYQLNTGDTDNGEEIVYDLKTRWIEVVSLAYTQIVKQVASYSKVHRGMMLSWQADDDSETTWREISKLDEFVFTSRNDLNIRGHRIRFRISGANRKEQWIWEGVDILNNLVRVPKT